MDDGLGEGVEVARRLGRGPLPGGGRLARGVDDAFDALCPRRRQSVDAGDGAGRDEKLRPRLTGPATQVFEKRRVGQGAGGDHREVDAGIEDGVGIFGDGTMAGALGNQVGPHRHHAGDIREHPATLGRQERCPLLAVRAHQEGGDTRPGLVTGEVFNHRGRDGAGADECDVPSQDF